MRNIKRTFLIFIIVVTLFSGIKDGENKPVLAQNVTRFQSRTTHLLADTAERVSFDILIPWQQLELTPVSMDGQDYLQVSMPGCSTIAESGLPALPIAIEKIGVPLGANITVTVKPGKSHTISLSNPILPVPTQWVEKSPMVENAYWEQIEPVLIHQPSPQVYEEAGPFPGDLAVISNDGIIRQQRVIAVTAYPVQYTPEEGELIVYESLQIDVSFDSETPITERQIKQESAAFEDLFSQTLLNYESARAFRGFVDGVYGQSVSTSREMPSWMPPNPGWRIAVREEGFYKLGYPELSAVEVGWPASVSSSTIQVFNMGQEVAIQVADGGDGYFDNDSDFILFYGQGLSSKYTRDNVYWLSYDPDGLAVGLRMDITRDGTPSGAPQVESYSTKKIFEYNEFYMQNAPYESNLDQWVKAVFSQASEPNNLKQTFSLNEPYPAQASLSMSMVGNLNYPTISPDHHVIVTLNGTDIGETQWDGIAWHETIMDIAPTILKSGENSLVISLPADLTGEYDWVGFDWIELTYANKFHAEDNQLPFSFENSTTEPQSYGFVLSDFSTNDIYAFDVSDPWAVVPISNIVIEPVGDFYEMHFQDTIPASSIVDYWAVGATAFRTVSAIEKDQSANLAEIAMDADHIVISHGDFIAQAQWLSTLRNTQGLPSVTVDVQDVYDQFNFGIMDPLAIRDFLAYAYDSWGTSYVVLVGDGHYDPKAYKYDEKGTFIPPFLADADPWHGETAADNRYVTFLGEDAMPDMMLGRLAVSTPTEAEDFIDKIIAYESQSGDWQSQVLAVADEQGTGDPDFPAVSDALLNDYLPLNYQAEKVYLGITHETGDLAKQAIMTGIDSGKLFVNYIGHGNTSFWSSELILRNTYLADLDNEGKLPIFLTMTCNNGYYLYPQIGLDYDSLAEALTKIPDKGAVASWSPTAFGLTSGHNYLIRGFYQAVFDDGIERIGQATFQGKLNLWAASIDSYLLDTFLLFGDPAMSLPTASDETFQIFLPLIVQ